MGRFKIVITAIVLFSISILHAQTPDSAMVIPVGQHRVVLSDPGDYREMTRQLDSVERLVQKEKAEYLQTYLKTGFIPAGYVKIDYRKLIHYNGFEGWKAGVGIWTDESLMKSLSLGGYWTRSFRRNENLFGAGAEVKILPAYHASVGGMYREDYYETGSYAYVEHPLEQKHLDLSHFLTETMDQSQSVDLHAEMAINEHLFGVAAYQYLDVIPLIPYRFFTGIDAAMPSFVVHHASLKTAVVAGDISRKSATRLYFNLIHGSGREIDVFRFQKAELSIKQSIPISKQQISTLRINAAALTGQMPVTLLYSALGSYKPVGLDVAGAFGSMRMNEFAADRFVAIFVNHSVGFGGRNEKIIHPSMDLRFNFGMGSVRKNEYPIPINSFEKGYCEAGLAFNNLVSLGVISYGVAAYYRLGAYAFDSGKDNFAFKFVIVID